MTVSGTDATDWSLFTELFGGLAEDVND